jgi:hypothetical protein
MAMTGLQKGSSVLYFVLGTAALLTLVGFGVFRLAKENDTVTLPPQTRAAPGAIPPIDANQPTEFETATFALG